jgi:pectinesterase
MKKTFYVLFLLVTLSIASYAQEISALWELTNATQHSVVTSGVVTAVEQKITGLAINGWAGNNTAAKLYSITGGTTTTGFWPNETAYNSERFAEYKVAPKAGNAITIKSIKFDIGNSGGSYNLRANFFYSTDDFATSTALGIVDTLPNKAMHTKTFDNLNIEVPDGKTLTFRIFPWATDGGASSGKYANIQNVLISGSAAGAPAPFKALWPYEDETKDGAVTQGVVVANQSYSNTMKFYGLTNLDVTTGGTLKVGSVQTVSKTWVAEPNPTDTLYFQYEVSPKPGGSLNVNSISYYIGGWFSSNIRAALYYSKDATFATKSLLVPDTLLVGNKIQKFDAALSETVNDGETLYFRFYPHNTKTEGWAKLVAIDSVLISGTGTGVNADAPTVTTTAISYVSTTFLTSGGKISTDGGAEVTARGVCWNTAGNPTVNDGKTIDGSGTGTFKSNVTGLTPGTTYYFRAYATNSAGTGYGEELTVTTLAAKAAPTVTTKAVSTILAKSASSGGTVTDWGGDSVTVRGICWSTNANPTINDFKTENGSDIGSFNSSMVELTPKTTYYVKAYAVNSIGVGYGEELSFTTQEVAPTVTKTVAKDGSGDYTSVQAAFDAVPDYYSGTYKIFVKKGVYYEKLLLGEKKSNVILEGEDRDSTILTYDDYAGNGKPGMGTSMSYSVGIDASDFTAMNITFRNTIVNDGSVSNQQGVALRSNGDRQAFYNCNLLGYQDTYYAWGGSGVGRVYMKDCYIEGSVDFIFGRDIVLFDKCTININRNGGSLTAASTEAYSKFGLVFKDCKITSDAVGFDGTPITSFLLGRPWQAAPRTVFINCEEPASLNPAGWSTWNVTPALYAEYKCYGDGSDFSSRLSSISRQLTDDEAKEYSVKNIFSKKSNNPAFGFDWIPDSTLVTSVEDEENNFGQLLPTHYEIMQNYPNPFNPSTVIKYQLPKNSMVKVIVYDILGKEVIKLVDAEQPAGNYEVKFNAGNLASGIYFYRISANDFVQTKKMMFLK